MSAIAAARLERPMQIDINRTVAGLLGIVLIGVGLIGFVWKPTIVAFGVNTTHNLFHLVPGAALLWAASSGRAAARGANLTIGLLYGLVAVLGLVGRVPGTLLNADADAIAHADDALHLVLALVFLAASARRAPAP